MRKRPMAVAAENKSDTLNPPRPATGKGRGPHSGEGEGNKGRASGLLLSLISILLFPLFAHALDLAEQRNFDIPPQSLSKALLEFSRQAGIQVVVGPEVNEQSTAGVTSKHSISDALNSLLKTTELAYSVVGESSITVGIPATKLNHASPGTGEGPGVREDGKLRLAQAEGQNKDERSESQSSSNSSSTVSTETEENKPVKLEEIVVTAQKRVERLQDVPVPVTAIDADSLVDSNQMRIQDYYTRIPGFSLIMLGDVGSPTLTIRGVTTGGYVNPTVGTTVDDVPFGGSIGLAGGATAPDFDPSELARIEVLRGPQGTLYGASSLGGLLKYVTVDPSTDRFSARVQAGTTSVENGSDFGYNVRGSVNIPISNTLALRASTFTRREPGYIDDPVLGKEDVNQRDTGGGRIAALWKPSEIFSLKLSALVQQSQRDGEDTVHRLTGLRELEHSDLTGTGWYDIKLQAYSAIMTAELGRADLTSVSGYSINNFNSALDATPNLGVFTQSGVPGTSFTGFGVRGTSQVVDWTTEKFSQELRLSMPIVQKVDWLLGAFYTRENYPNDTTRFAIDPTGAVAGVWDVTRYSHEFTEYAAFTDFTFHVTDRFDVQVGGRKSWIETTTGAEGSTGPFNLLLGRGSETFSSAGFASKDSAFTYLVTPQFRFSSDLMVYARLASGYRPGGPNTIANVPPEYSADTTENYEIGIKSELFNRKLSLDASIYHIDWKDIQIQLRDTLGLIYYANAGRARSRGVELSVESRPLKGLTLAAWGAWNDAELTEIPSNSLLRANVGDRLPYSSPLSGSLAIDQKFPLWGSASGFVGASASYVDNRKGRFFTNTLPRQALPAYTQVDIRAGTRFDTWTISAFVNNLTDERGVLRGGRDAALSLSYAFTYIQPRTMGLSLSKTFD